MIEKTEPGKTVERRHPRHRRPARARPRRSKSSRAGARRDEPRKQQGHATWRSSNSHGGQRLSLCRWLDLRSIRHAGIVAIAAGAVALVALIALRRAGARRCDACAAPSGCVLGEQGTAGSGRARRGAAGRASQRCASTSRTPARGSTAASPTSRRRCAGRSPTARWCATTPTTSCPGQQSMSIALLDDEQSGIVLSCIHHRDQARVYAKQVHGGQRRTGALARGGGGGAPRAVDAGASLAPGRRAEHVGLRWPARRARSAISGRRAPSARRRCWPARRPTPSSRSRWRRIYDTVMALRDGDRRLGDRADRELARRLGQRHARPARRRGRRRRDRRRGAAARAPLADRRRAARARARSTTVLYAPAGARASARASCASELPHARDRSPASSTAEAVRTVVAERRARAGGARHAAGGDDLRRDGDPRGRRGPRRQRDALRLAGAHAARRASRAPLAGAGDRRRVEDLARLLGRRRRAARAGWCAAWTSSRSGTINLTKIESRPRRERPGHYMFFADLAGRAGDARGRRARSRALRGCCEEVRVLGSYRGSRAERRRRPQLRRTTPRRPATLPR